MSNRLLLHLSKINFFGRSSRGDIPRGGVATDASGNAYVAGYTKGGLDSNTLAGTANDDEDYFIVKFDSNGNKQ